jgi:hypothetical protein
MKARRVRQLAREPGFTPVSNKRINAALSVAPLKAMLRNPALTPVQAEEQGYRDVAATLGRPRSSKLYRPRPSRSDDPAWRNKALRA